MEDVRGAAGAVAFGETGDGAVVEQLDPLDRSMDAIAVGNGEEWETLVFFIPWGYLLPYLLLESLQPLVEVSNHVCILILFLLVDPVLLLDSLYEGLSDTAESDWVVDVEPLDDVSSGGQ